MPKGKWWTAKTYKGPAKFTRAQSKNRNSPKFDTPKVYTKLFQTPCLSYKRQVFHNLKRSKLLNKMTSGIRITM